MLKAAAVSYLLMLSALAWAQGPDAVYRDLQSALEAALASWR
jgi:hypothetical protein